MSEDERQEMLRTVAEAHTGLRELAFRLGRELRLKAPALKAAIRAEGVVFGLKRELQQLDLDDPELPRRREAVSEVRRGGKAVDRPRPARAVEGSGTRRPEPPTQAPERAGGHGSLRIRDCD